ncbi:hypothetical protein SMKI_04G0460 [Saccharomyces mikatae IFO 1815]|uniref:Asf2p n=1 Tax=Saccharomyces mikatae IFO 1815 TaxID=226126 RepID=A0AA35IXJ4_SACMI|nr:uncharacterized protein SMKI_04G0460 [Saccharomyces mikatae IFO 1815]CAI4037716.1 hypothetical protein SMKI_04G0460 [Saccharomyces mikatae IFO 1815]
MSENRGVLDSIICNAIDGSDHESSSSFYTDEEYAAVTKDFTNPRVQKRPSSKKKKSRINDLQSLVSHYQENEAALVSSTKVLSREIMGYEIKIASLYGQMKSVMDENNVLKEAYKSFSKKKVEPLRLPSSDEEPIHEGSGLLVDLKKEICAKLQDYNDIQSTVNTKLDEIHMFYEKYYEGLELKVNDKLFEEETSKELAKVRQELKDVRKNSEIKVNNLKMQLIQTTNSLELLKKEAKAKDDCLKSIPELVEKTNRTLLSYKKSIANQKETIEALQAELSLQLEAQPQKGTQSQVQALTNVTLVDPFDENGSKDLLSIQERELQELRLYRKISDEKSRTAHLHLERQNNTIKLLQSYIQSLVQRLPPSQQHKLRNDQSSENVPAMANAPNSVSFLPLQSRHLEADSDPQRFLPAIPDGNSGSEKGTVSVAPKLNLDHISRPPYFTKLRPPHLINLNSLTLKTLPKAIKSTYTDPQQLVDDHQLPSNDKPQENANNTDPSKIETVEPVTVGTPASTEVQTLKDSNLFPETT